MGSLIRQTPWSPRRLPGESAVAYRAFSVYLNLGPDLSLDHAYKRFCDDQGKNRKSARHPGSWSAWSQKYKWGKRAKAHDELMDEERRSEAAEIHSKLRDMRLRFALEVQERHQNRFGSQDSLLEVGSSSARRGHSSAQGRSHRKDNELPRSSRPACET
jgi:hypothetical protein